jgi:hypothetical protein
MYKGLEFFHSHSITVQARIVKKLGVWQSKKQVVIAGCIAGRSQQERIFFKYRLNE